MEKKYDVYALGNALVDTEIEVSDAFLERMEVGKGLMTLVDQARQAELLQALEGEAEPHKLTSGGSACNTVVAARQFGGSGYYACKVAGDDTGDIFVRELLAAGVDTNMNGNRPRGISGRCLVMITPDAERTMNTFLGISEQVSEDEVDEQIVAASRYVYLEGYLVSSPSARAAAIRLRQLAEKNGVGTALTFSDPAMVRFFRDGLTEMLGDGVDLLFCNEDEAKGFTDTDTPEAALEALKPLCRTLVMTRGAEGSLLWDGQQAHAIPCDPVKPVDTNGAGDMFAGAYLYAITHGHDAVTAARLANAAAGRLIVEFGPRLPNGAHQEIRQRILGE
ncbi:Ribokinase [Alloalcanivorax xenomutans]|jgi:sugar/nucleoside kinase (ribokinase family)|uniref:adenosine kinase n=1 Tax=Alloalcanivorax xenomutans TaxID=1094342 RepID=UPI0006D5BCAD|nr:adenosine kinase [Alloalcanivorax xenomutans]CUR46009.1 Ribokinase [Alloalcanivorax xenomutans]